METLHNEAQSKALAFVKSYGDAYETGREKQGGIEAYENGYLAGIGIGLTALFCGMDVGHEIKYRRLKKGLTQQQLADLTGHTKSYISDIEKGRRSLSIDTLMPFIKAMGGELKIEWSDKP